MPFDHWRLVGAARSVQRQSSRNTGQRPGSPRHKEARPASSSSRSSCPLTPHARAQARFRAAAASTSIGLGEGSINGDGGRGQACRCSERARSSVRENSPPGRDRASHPCPARTTAPLASPQGRGTVARNGPSTRRSGLPSPSSSLAARGPTSPAILRAGS